MPGQAESNWFSLAVDVLLVRECR